MVLVPTFARTMLRWQIVLVGACCLAIAAIVVGNVAIVAKLRESALDQVRQALERRSFAVAAQANLSLQSVSLVLNAVTERLAPNQIEDADGFRRRGTASNIQQILVQQIVGLPQIEALGLVDLDGNVINSSRPMRGQFTVADRDYFIAFRDNPALERYVSVPIRSRNSGVQGIVVIQRVLGADGTTVGFVGSFIKLEFFESYWRSVMDHSENESSISLNRFDGTVLARFPRTDVIGTKFADGMQSRLRDANALVVRKRGSIDGKMRIEAARVLEIIHCSSWQHKARTRRWPAGAAPPGLQPRRRPAAFWSCSSPGLGFGAGGRNISTAWRRKPVRRRQNLPRPGPRPRSRFCGRASGRPRGSTVQLSTCRTAF